MDSEVDCTGTSSDSELFEFVKSLSCQFLPENSQGVVKSMGSYLIFVALALLLLVVALLIQLRTVKRYRRSLEADLETTKKHAEALSAEVKRLSKWKGVDDADAKAAELLETAQQAMHSASAEANKLTEEARQQAASCLAAAEAEAKTISSIAKQNAQKLRSEADAQLNSATTRAAQIVETANKRAEEIAGSAFDAMNNAKLYERTLKAMKNAIEGYGDAYLIPSQSLLDDLAEEFGFAEAGQELKRARETTKLMVKNGTAAACQYVEANRRDTAIGFVVDAFNGKVDSILSTVKNNNAGTLAQEIRDAFTMVNYNGRAFREARITEEFLDARLAELKWAAIAQQLKLEEREEQRRITEQMREEERARREYERAIKEAARDEDALRRAMEKAQLQIDQASTEQKAKYEAQLADLRSRLLEAEARSQRALSMAQQTKRGYVYIISNVGSFGEDVFKIGLTRRLEPLDRVRELGDSSVPFEFDVHAMILAEDAPALESRLHKHFVLGQMNKVNHRKEFFNVGIGHIREEIEKLGIEAKWTMTAQAREYHETQAIEQRIKEDPKAREAWVNRQFELERTEELSATVSTSSTEKEAEEAPAS